MYLILANGLEMECDAEDWIRFQTEFEDIRLYDNGCGYAYFIWGGKHIYFHRWVMNLNDPSLEIDHIDGNPYNNKKEIYFEIWDFTEVYISNEMDADINTLIKEPIKRKREKIKIQDGIRFLDNIKTLIDKNIDNIWYISWKLNKKENCLDFFIKIKGEYLLKYNHKKYVKINWKNISEKNVLNKLEESMEEILENIQTLDGIHSNKRHMLVEREVL
jgi:hypothetical protein